MGGRACPPQARRRWVATLFSLPGLAVQKLRRRPFVPWSIGPLVPLGPARYSLPATAGRLLDLNFQLKPDRARCASSEQFPKLLGGQPGRASDVAHGIGVDGGMPRNLDHHHAVGESDVFALAHDAEAAFLQYPDRITLADARNPRHSSDRDFLVLHGTHRGIPSDFGGFGREILGDGFPNIRQGLVPRRALRAAARQRVAPNRPPFIGFNQGDRIFHGEKLGRA